MNKRNRVVAGVLILSGVAGTGLASTNVRVQNDLSITVTAKVTIEEAEKTALAKVPGTLDDKWGLENDNGEIVTYVFFIKDKAGKFFGVHIDVSKGTVILVEDYEALSKAEG